MFSRGFHQKSRRLQYEARPEQPARRASRAHLVPHRDGN